jgi:formamidopyrimidine-DNA glycosylase
MPELPEVETARLLVQRHCLGKKIIKVIGVESGGGPRTGQFDEIIHQGTLNAQTLEECLVGKTIESTARKGKIQIWKLSGGQEATIHFGMTGSWSIEGIKGSEYVRYSVNTSNWPPKFTKLELIFADNTRLALTDPRRLAKFRLSLNAFNEPPVSDLAPDAYLELPSLNTFITSIRKKSTAIKALLLDQNAIASGIGNWIIDEVLYQSAIHPETSCDAIDDIAFARLHQAIIDVIGLAVKVEAESDKFPKNWLFHYRWGKGKDGKNKKMHMAIQ